MTNAEALSVLTGPLVALAVSLIKRPDWSTQARIAVAVFVSGALGFATALVANQFVWDWGNALVDAAIVFGSASTFYTLILERSGLEQKLRAI